MPGKIQVEEINSIDSWPPSLRATSSMNRGGIPEALAAEIVNKLSTFRGGLHVECFHSESRMYKGLWKEWNVEGDLYFTYDRSFLSSKDKVIFLRINLNRF